MNGDRVKANGAETAKLAKNMPVPYPQSPVIPIALNLAFVLIKKNQANKPEAQNNNANAGRSRAIKKVSPFESNAHAIAR